MFDVKQLTPVELLKLHAEVSEQLRERGVVRSSNNPTGDLAEYLFCKAFQWKQADNSNPYVDATADDGQTFYQIKGRRMTRHNRSRQLGALRGLPDAGFHFLAAVLFDENYSVVRAAIVPHELVHKKSRYIEHTNSWKFLLRDDTWTWPGVIDATDQLRSLSF